MAVVAVATGLAGLAGMAVVAVATGMAGLLQQPRKNEARQADYVGMVQDTIHH